MAWATSRQVGLEAASLGVTKLLRSKVCVAEQAEMAPVWRESGDASMYNATATATRASIRSEGSSPANDIHTSD
jgi:hypothetical protein